MAINRTSMIDDDGSGTTGTIINNAWKQELYNQIDAFGAGLPIVYGTWTPVDISGAGLTLNVTSATYAKIGRVVCVWAHLGYPATSNGNDALLSGLPFTNSSQTGGFYLAYGSPVVLHLGANSTAIQLLVPTSMAPYTNAALSGALLIFSGVYLIF